MQKEAGDGPTSREEKKGYGPHNLVADGGQISPELSSFVYHKKSDFP